MTRTGDMQTFLACVVLLVYSVQSARADEQQTLFGKTVDGWIAVLRDGKSTFTQRVQAVRSLGDFGPEARAAVPLLVELLRDNKLEDAAVAALARIGSADDLIVPILIEKFVKQGCQHLTGQGTFGGPYPTKNALVRIGGLAVPALINVLNGANWDMRVCAADALSEIGPAARAAVPSLIRAIKDSDRQHDAEILRRHAVRALGRIGPEARAAVPALNERLGKNDDNDFEAVKALDAIGAPPVQERLEALLRDGDPYVAKQLAWLGPKAHAAAPALRVALADKRPQFRFSAACALAFIDPSVNESIPVLIEALNYLDHEVIEASGAPRRWLISVPEPEWHCQRSSLSWLVGATTQMYSGR